MRERTTGVALCVCDFPNVLRTDRVFSLLKASVLIVLVLELQVGLGAQLQNSKVNRDESAAAAGAATRINQRSQLQRQIILKLLP